jgi:hypothetical protein
VTPDLTFNIAELWLFGSITYKAKKHSFDARSYSGGRGGSTTPGAIDPRLANNPFATHVKGQEANKLITKVGGPIPIGVYSLKTSTTTNRIDLTPANGTWVSGRTGFQIHGTGPKGSIGCIVPSDFHVVTRLYGLLEDIEEHNLPAPTLQVIAVGADMDRFLKVNNFA